MKQTRRGFLGRIAAIAAAVAVVPAVKADASPLTPDTLIANNESVAIPRPAHVEIRNRGDGPRFRTLTFDAMQADCAARGCSLEGWLDLYWDPIQYRAVHAMAPRLDPDEPHALFSIDVGTPGRLERLDAWRRGLHEQEPTIVASLGNGIVADVHVNDDGSWRLCQNGAGLLPESVWKPDLT